MYYEVPKGLLLRIWFILVIEKPVQIQCLRCLQIMAITRFHPRPTDTQRLIIILFIYEKNVIVWQNCARQKIISRPVLLVWDIVRVTGLYKIMEHSAPK